MAPSYRVFDFSGHSPDAAQKRAIVQAARVKRADQSIVIDQRGDVDLVPKIDAVKLAITPEQQGAESLYDASGNPNLNAALGKIYAVMAEQGGSSVEDVSEQAAGARAAIPSGVPGARSVEFDPMGGSAATSDGQQKTSEFLASVRGSFDGPGVDLSGLPGAVGGALENGWDNLTQPADMAHAIEVVRTQGKG